MLYCIIECLNIAFSLKIKLSIASVTLKEISHLRRAFSLACCLMFKEMLCSFLLPSFNTANMKK